MTHSPLTHTGHVSLNDGSIIRLDYELGGYSASFYAPDRRERAHMWSLEIEVAAAAIAGWLLKFDTEEAA